MFPNPPSAVIITPRPASWGELATAALVGAALASLFWLFFAVPCAVAGGGVTLTWDQGSDCTAIDGWELSVAPITTQQPNPQPSPSPATLIGVSVPRSGPCGLAMSRAVTVPNAVGPARFWLRAVAGSVRSNPSNLVDASLPLAAPAGLTIVVP